MRPLLLLSLVGILTAAEGPEPAAATTPIESAQQRLARAQDVADRLIASLPAQLARTGDASDRLRAGIALLCADGVRELGAMRSAIGVSDEPALYPPFLGFGFPARRWDDGQAARLGHHTVTIYVQDLLNCDYRGWVFGGNGAGLGQTLLPYARDRYLDLAGGFIGLLGAKPGLSLARALGVAAAPSPVLRQAGSQAPGDPEFGFGDGPREQTAINLALLADNTASNVLDAHVEREVAGLVQFQAEVLKVAQNGSALPTSGSQPGYALVGLGETLGRVAVAYYQAIASITPDDPMPETDNVYSRARALIATQFVKRYTLAAEPEDMQSYTQALDQNPMTGLLREGDFLGAPDALHLIGNYAAWASNSALAIAAGFRDLGDQVDREMDVELQSIAAAEASSLAWAEAVSWKWRGDDRYFDWNQYNTLEAILRPGYEAARQRAASYLQKRLDRALALPHDTVRSLDAALYRRFAAQLDPLIDAGLLTPPGFRADDQPVVLPLHVAALQAITHAVDACTQAVTHPAGSQKAIVTDGYRQVGELLAVKTWADQTLLGQKMARPPIGPADRSSFASTMTAVWLTTRQGGQLLTADIAKSDAQTIRDAPDRMRTLLIALADLDNTTLALHTRGVAASDPDLQATQEMYARLFGPGGQLASELLEIQQACKRITTTFDTYLARSPQRIIVTPDIEATFSVAGYGRAHRGIISLALGAFTSNHAMQRIALHSGHALGLACRSLVLRTAAFGPSNRVFATGSALALRTRDVRQNLTGALVAALDLVETDKQAGVPAAWLGSDDEIIRSIARASTSTNGSMLPSGERPCIPFLATTYGDGTGLLGTQEIVDWSTRLALSASGVTWGTYHALTLRTALVGVDALTSAVYAASQVEAVREEDAMVIRKAYAALGDDQ